MAASRPLRESPAMGAMSGAAVKRAQRRTAPVALLIALGLR
jgi:hypothetical protein